MEERCENCRFWFLSAMALPRPLGVCRRYPPKVFMLVMETRGPSEAESKLLEGIVGRRATGAGVQQPVFPSAWPQSPAEHWCGEHKPIDNNNGVE